MKSINILTLLAFLVACSSMRVEQQEQKEVSIAFLKPTIVPKDPVLPKTLEARSDSSKPELKICVKTEVAESGKLHGKQEANFLARLIDIDKSCAPDEKALKKSYLENYLSGIDSQCSLHASMMGAYASNLNMRSYYSSRYSSCLEKKEMAEKTASAI